MEPINTEESKLPLQIVELSFEVELSLIDALVTQLEVAWNTCFPILLMVTV